MPPTRRPADDFPDDLRLQKDEADSAPLFREERRADRPPSKAKPYRDPLDVPLDEPLDEPARDPMDDFVPIEPDGTPYSLAADAPPKPKGPRVSARPAKSSGSSPRRERPETPPPASNKWLLPAGIALVVLCVVVPVILVMASGPDSKPASPLPVYPPSGPVAFVPDAQSPKVVSGKFGEAFTPGKQPETPAGEPITLGAPPVPVQPMFPGQNYPFRPPVMPQIPMAKMPNIEDFMPKLAAPPKFVPAPVPVPPADERRVMLTAKPDRLVLARVGQRFAYRVQLSLVPAYPLTYEVTEGPEGLTISDTGLLTWAEPTGDDGVSLPVKVRITNRQQGVDLTDSFRILIRKPAKP